jgi:hypothetical protein
MMPAAAGSYEDSRDLRRRLRSLLFAHGFKSAGWALTFQWGRLAREWRLWHARMLIERSRQFDKVWYRAQNPDVAQTDEDPILHYLRQGAAEGRNPHPLFDTRWYLARYADARASGVNPLVHFIEQGARAGYDPGPCFSSAWILACDPHATELGPLKAYLRLARPKSSRRRPRPAQSPADDVPKNGDAILEYRRARRPGNRIVAFTAIVGNYDTLRVPSILDPDIDYVCFSDTPRSDLGLFEIRALPFRHDDPVRAARFVKTHPHLLFPDHDVAIWMDATIVIASDVKPLIARLNNSDMAVGGISHPRGHDIYDEAYHCARSRKDDLVAIAAQVARYLTAGVPKGLSVPDSSFMIWNLRHAAAAQVLDSWWDEIAAGSRRDQISFNYALWRHGEDWLRLLKPKAGTRQSPGLVLRPHIPSDGRNAISPADVPARVIDPQAATASRG